MPRRLSREYVEDPQGAVVADRRPILFSPVSTIVGLLLLALLVWAIFWGPIGELFDGDGQGPSVTVDKPSLEVNE